MRRSTLGAAALALAAGLLTAWPAAAQDYYDHRAQTDDQQRMRQRQGQQGQRAMTQEEWERQRRREQQQSGTYSNPTTTGQNTTRYGTQPARPRTWDQREYDRNPYGVGRDVQDDKWDTGTWDMGEHDTPQWEAQKRDRWEVDRRDGDGYDRNPYGVGRDVQDDAWDTGLWDMGEHDTPELRARKQERWGDQDYRYDYDRADRRGVGDRVRGWFSDEDDRNPFGVGDDVFDDKWDTGGVDMGEYNAWDHPREYYRDLEALQQGRFHQQYGLRDPHDRRTRGLRDDDVWDGREPWYNNAGNRIGLDRDGDVYEDYNDRRQQPRYRDQDRFYGSDEPEFRGTRDRIRVPLINRDNDGRGLRLGDATDSNPYGTGDDVFDDKWDTGAWDMGEYNAWDHPDEYQADLQLLQRGEFHRRYGIPEGRAEDRSAGLRSDDVWDGRQPWYDRDDDRPAYRSDTRYRNQPREDRRDYDSRWR